MRVRVTCPTCNERYNDETAWTICPHMPIDGPCEPFHPTTNPNGYCREHDLFSCPNHGELNE